MKIFIVFDTLGKEFGRSIQAIVHSVHTFAPTVWKNKPGLQMIKSDQSGYGPNN